MPIVTSELTSPGGLQAPFAIVDDALLKGGFRAVEKKSDLDLISPSMLKVGMYIAVNEEQGKIYECVELQVEVDEFGDEFLAKKVFSPLVIGAASSSSTKLLNRVSKKISFNDIRPNQVIEMPVDLGCRSCVIIGARVSAGRKMEIEIFCRKDKLDPIPYLFNSYYRYFDDGSTYLKNKARFQYKKFYVLANDEPETVDQRIFIVRCRSLEDDTYRTSLTPNSTDVDFHLTYIPLEA